MPIEDDQDIIINPEAIQGARVPARLEQMLPAKLILLPLQARPFFPAQTMPIVIDEERWSSTVEQVGNSPHHLVGLVYVGGEPDRMPSADDFASVGTIVRVHNATRGDGKIQFIAEGLQRFKIVRIASEKAPYIAEVEYPPTAEEITKEIRAYALAVINQIKELLPLNPLYKENVRAYLDRFSPDDASPLADFAAALTSSPGPKLQEVLETVPLLRRMEKVMLLIQHELEIAGLQTEIRQRVEDRFR
jgi:ATP-dependent Lon protease